ncbi:hypothetical protein QIS74_06148 [Colletotrichum tabaci]|uniref:Uncharacterized protein n=1 Tax=Colletotrichum tabaci TaxID=1209068 RepID=A0AAV9TFF2_9PEZI
MARSDHNGSHAPSVASDTVDETFAYPFSLPPPNARAGGDVGLSEAEVEDIRRLLALYVQEKEKVCRGTTKLNEGILMS